MAIEGAYNAQQFAASRPDALSWQQHMMYWDTQNPFSAGERAPQARAQPVNMLGSGRNLSFGGRNYGSQDIDRNEWGRLGSVVVPTVSAMLQSREQGVGRQRAGSGTEPTEESPNRLQQAWRKRQLTKQGIPMPPQPTAKTPGTLPPPTLPTPHTLATSNWRAEQAQRIADNLNQIGRAPVTINPTLEASQSYQQERAQERVQNAQRRTAEASIGTGGAPPPPPATNAERMANAQRRIASQQATRRPPTEPLPQAVPNRPAPNVMPSPITAVGGQEERLAAEGTAPTTPVKRPGSVGTVPIKTPSLLIPPKPI